MGWGNGKGGYGWGYPPMMMMMPWGKGKGKGLRGFANEKKVWIGGLPAGPTSIETNKKLKEHMSQAGECIFAEINKNGIAGCRCLMRLARLLSSLRPGARKALQSQLEHLGRECEEVKEIFKAGKLEEAEDRYQQLLSRVQALTSEAGRAFD
eukprot:g9613.t1